MKTPEIPNMNTTGKHRVDVSNLETKFHPKRFKYLSPEYIDYRALSITEVGDLKRGCGVDLDVKAGQLTYSYDGHNIWSTDPEVEVEDIFHEQEREQAITNVDNPVPSF